MKCFPRFLRLSGLVLSCWLLTSVAWAQQPLRLAFPEYQPFFYRDQHGALRGFFYEIVNTALAERMGQDVVWEAFPWKRCQLNVQSGASDAMITVPTRGRLDYAVTHPTPFYVKSMNVFTYAGHPKLEEIRKIRGVDDILAAGLSVVTYAGNGWNDEHIRSRGIAVVEASIRESVWMLLASRRGDLIIEWPGGAWPDIRKYSLQHRIVETDVVLETMPFHLLISKRSGYARLLTKFQQTIHLMREDGTIDAIIARYQAFDRPPE